MTNIDMTIRNLDEEVIRNFKAEAIRENKTLGEATVEAFKLWLEHRLPMIKERTKLTDIKPVSFKSGFKDLSKRIDEILYSKGR